MAEGATSGVGEIKNLLALAIYVTLGGHLVLLAGVARSLDAIPPGGTIDAVRGGTAIVALAGTIFDVAVRAAAPVIAALLLANFALAILSRAVPQLQAMAIAFPITIGLGFLVMGAALPFTGAFVGEWVGTLPGTVARTVGAFVPAGGH